MILNVQPSLMRIITALEDSTIRDPNEMAGWWLAGRAERTQPVDSANSEPNARVVRAARPRWPRLQRTDRAKGDATQSAHSCDLGFRAAKS
jgi:hypothetical protein